MRRWITILVAICILLLLTGRYYQKTVAGRLPILNSAPCDFLPYYQAAQHIVHGDSPYLADGYIYPPLLAFLLTPIAPLEYVTARRVWFAVSQLFLIAGAMLLWRRFGRDWASACWIACVWALGGAAAEALGVGQVGPLLMFLIVVALARRHRQRGAAVGLGFALKLFPGLLGVAVLLRGERRAVHAMIATALAAVLAPWAAVVIFLHGPAGLAKGHSWTGTPAALSWSLPSLAVRALDPDGQRYLLPRNWMLGTNLEHFHLPFHLIAVSLAVALLTLAAGLLALVRSTGFRPSEDQIPWAMAALVSLALVASPVSWTHYQVLQYPGVALLLISDWRQRQWVQLLSVLALAALLYPLPIHVFDAFSARYRDIPPRSVSVLYLWTSVAPIASLTLFAMFVRRAAPVRLAHEPPLRSPDHPGYIHLQALTRRGRLHGDPRSPARGVSGR